MYGHTRQGLLPICLLDIASTLAILRTMKDRQTDRLGEMLSSARRERQLTLRAVEATAGISNAYLSQLEGGKIKEPSPTVLFRLAELLGLSYADLLAAAGYPVPGRTTSEPTGLAARFGATTTQEENALAEYLQFLRSRSRKGGRR